MYTIQTLNFQQLHLNLKQDELKNPNTYSSTTKEVAQRGDGTKKKHTQSEAESH